MSVLLHDRDILSATRQSVDKGYATLKFTLPDGEVMNSDSIPLASLKAGVLISWCNAIRDRWEAKQEGEKAEMETKRKRRIDKEEEERLAALKAAEVAGLRVPGNAVVGTELPQDPAVQSPGSIIAVPEGGGGDALEVETMLNEYYAAQVKLKLLEYKLKKAGVV